MATGKKSKTSLKTAATEPKPAAKIREIRVELSVSNETPMAYANYIEVAHSEHDFTLLMARVPAKITAEQLREAESTGKVLVEPEMQVIVPTSLIPALIDALQASRATWNERFAANAGGAENVHTKH